MFVVYFGVAGRQPLQGYTAPLISFIIFNKLTYLYAMVINLEINIIS